MDWNNLAVILIWLWIARWTLGVGYGLYLVSEQKGWIWQDKLLCGPLFWIGWFLGRGVRRLVRWRKNLRTQ